MTWTPVTANLVVTLGGASVAFGWWWGRRAARIPFYEDLRRAKRDGTDVWLNRGRDDEFVGTVVRITDRTVVFNDGHSELVEWDLSLIRTREVFQERFHKSAGTVFEIGRIGHPRVDISGSRALSKLKLFENGRASFTEENERTGRLFYSPVGERYRCRFSRKAKIWSCRIPSLKLSERETPGGRSGEPPAESMWCCSIRGTRSRIHIAGLAWRWSRTLRSGGLLRYQPATGWAG